MRRQVTFPLKDNSWKGKYRNGVIFTIFTIPGTYIYIKQEPRECLSHGQKLSAQIRGHFWFSSLGKQSNIQVIALISDLISCYFCFIQMKLSSLMRFACKIDHMVLILDRFLFASWHELSSIWSSPSESCSTVSNAMLWVLMKVKEICAHSQFTCSCFSRKAQWKDKDHWRW